MADLVAGGQPPLTDPLARPLDQAGPPEDDAAGPGAARGPAPREEADVSEETSGTKVQRELERWTSTTRARAVEEVAERMGGRFPLAGAETVQPLYVPRHEEEG